MTAVQVAELQFRGVIAASQSSLASSGESAPFTSHSIPAGTASSQKAAADTKQHVTPASKLQHMTSAGKFGPGKSNNRQDSPDQARLVECLQAERAQQQSVNTTLAADCAGLRKQLADATQELASLGKSQQNGGVSQSNQAHSTRHLKDELAQQRDATNSLATECDALKNQLAESNRQLALLGKSQQIDPGSSEQASAAQHLRAELAQQHSVNNSLVTDIVGLKEQLAEARREVGEKEGHLQGLQVSRERHSIQGVKRCCACCAAQLASVVAIGIFKAPTL